MSHPKLQFVRILKDQWNFYKRTIIFFILNFCTICFASYFLVFFFLFSMFSTIRLCVALQILLLLFQIFRPIGLLDLVAWICFLSYLQWTKSQCEMAIYITCVHFSFVFLFFSHLLALPTKARILCLDSL
jgi:hypothetical protein